MILINGKHRFVTWTDAENFIANKKLDIHKCKFKVDKYFKMVIVLMIAELTFLLNEDKKYVTGEEEQLKVAAKVAGGMLKLLYGVERGYSFAEQALGFMLNINFGKDPMPNVELVYNMEIEQ